MTRTPAMRVTAHTEADTERIGAELAAELRGGGVVALHGDLGAGKTCFVRGLARGLGHDPGEVTSPTYVIEHRYQRTGATPLAHLDAYRISSAGDLHSIGWDELLAQQATVIAVEWAERIAAALPEACTHVWIHHAPDGRVIEIQRHSAE